MNHWWAVIHKHDRRVACHEGRPAIFETREAARRFMRWHAEYFILKKVTLMLPDAP